MGMLLRLSGKKRMDETFTNQSNPFLNLVLHNCVINIGEYRHVTESRESIEVVEPIEKTIELAREPQRLKSTLSVKQLVVWVYYQWEVGIVDCSDEQGFKAHILQTYLTYNNKTKNYELINESTLNKEFSNFKNLQSDFNPRLILNQLREKKLKISEFDIISKIEEYNRKMGKVKYK
jgi:hypothetical protein